MQSARSSTHWPVLIPNHSAWHDQCGTPVAQYLSQKLPVQPR